MVSRWATPLLAALVGCGSTGSGGLDAGAGMPHRPVVIGQSQRLPSVLGLAPPLIAGTSPRDVWAAASGGGALVHWDGNSWSNVPWPSGLNGVPNLATAGVGFAWISFDRAVRVGVDGTITQTVPDVLTLGTRNDWGLGCSGTTCVVLDGNSFSPVALPSSTSANAAYVAGRSHAFAITFATTGMGAAVVAFDGTGWSPTPWPAGTMTGPPDDLWIVSRFAGGSVPGEGGHPSFWGWQASHFDGQSTTAFTAPIPTTDQYYRAGVLLTAPAGRVGAVDIRDDSLVYEEWDGAAWGEPSVLASGVYDQANAPLVTQLGDGHLAALVRQAPSPPAWLLFLE